MKKSDQSLFCLIGHPTNGSKSPVVHGALFEHVGIKGVFFNFDVEPEHLERQLQALKEMKIKGFSVTIPYKETVMAYMDELHPSAQNMGAVNSVRVKDGRFIGYNTDGDGLLLALEEGGIALKDARILVLGAGGAARGIVHALGRRAKTEPCHVILWNRTLDRATVLANEANSAYGCDFRTTDDPHVPAMLEVDLVINTTSMGMIPHESDCPCEPELFANTTIFCDIVYKPHETMMLKRAVASGHKIIHGIGMLIYQAIISEAYWHEGDDENPFELKNLDLTALKKEVFDKLESKSV